MPLLARRVSAALCLGGALQLVTIAVALVARHRSYPHMFVDGLLLPLSNDASYHVRRILRAAADLRYPDLFDPLLDWPHGAATHWSPGFDYIAAVIARILGGPDPASAARVTAVLPVVYGVIAVIIIGHLATRVVAKGDRFCWATAALFAALLPQNVGISQAGFVDHHVTEVLFVALLWRWTVACTELAEQRADLARRARFELAGAVLITLSVWVQSVGLLYVGIAAGVLVALPLARGSVEPAPHRWAGTGAPSLCGGAILLGLLYVPAVREHGHSFAYEFPSYFQPALLAVAGAAVAISSELARQLRGRALRPAALRFGASIVALAVVVAAVLAIAPTAGRALSGLLDLAGSQGPDLAKIDELQPLLAAPSAAQDSRWARLDSYFGWTGYALVALLPLGLLAARRAGRERWVAMALWTAILLGLSLGQNRWSRTLVVPIAVMSALALRRVAEWGIDALARWRSTREARAVRRPWPSGYAGFAAASLLLLAPDPARALAPQPQRAIAVMEAGLFLRTMARPVEPGHRSGLLAPWDKGFQLLHTSGLPLLSTGHAWLVGEEGYRLEQAAWGGTADALWSLMTERDLGFVVADADTLATVTTDDGEASIVDGPHQRQIRWDYFTKVPLGVMLLGGSGLPEIGVRHLEHLCPRFASSESVPLQVPIPRLWIFEHVAGAVVEGRAAPGSRVVAEILLQHAAGVVSYFAFTDADANGGFELRLPVPTRMNTGSLRSGKRIRLRRQGSAVTMLELSEAAVISGARIVVADATDSATSDP